MGTVYADRAFISVNGARLANIQSASLKQNHNRKAVKSMTNNRRDRGFVEGNLEIDISLNMALENDLARPKLEGIDYKGSDVQITFIAGAEVFVATGVFLKDNDDNAGGVGDEVKGTFNFGALDLKDTVGNSSLFNISL